MMLRNSLHQLRHRQASISVIGDLMIDRYLLGDCDRISPEAPVQIVHVADARTSLGGAGHVVSSLTTLGAQVRVAGVVGDDERGSVIMQMLSECGADAGGVSSVPGRKTTEKTRLLAAQQQVVRYDVETRAAIGPEVERNILARLFAWPTPDIFVVSDYGKGCVTDGLCRAVIARGNELGVPVVCDPKGADFGKYEGAFVVTPNLREAAVASGITIDDPSALERAGSVLRERFGFTHCLITLGKDGMALFSETGVTFVHDGRRELYDVTGAGDTVVATLAAGLGAGLPIGAACQLANVAAGIQVGKLGAMSVSIEEIEIAVAEAEASSAMAGRTIVSEDRAADIAAECRRGGGRVVFTNGCFDLLHRGHVELLEQAARLGDLLIVGLNSDASVRRIKGNGRPIHPVEDRAYVLHGLRAVDHVVAFDADTPIELIARIQPSVLVKGGDYRPDEIVGADIVRASGGEVHVVPLVPGMSTTDILRGAEVP